jgi:DNA glycosylase AlkZ-like
VSERVLTERELNRALLARQLLLERTKLSLPRALERMGGIQNQYAPNAYIRLWSCLDGFRREQLNRALERRTVVQGTLMRTTIHLISAREYWLHAVGLQRSAREWQLRVDRETKPAMRRRAKTLRKALAGGAKPARELGGLLSPHVPLWVELVRLPPSGTWERRRADLYELAERWLGPCNASEDGGLEHLIRRYLGGFGPAALDDVSSWAGVPVKQLEVPASRMRLRRFRDEQERELFDLPRARLPSPDAPAPVRFLPTWDAILLVHARRTGVLPDEYRPVVFNDKNPPSVPTFLVDGRVAGAWRHTDGRIELEPYERLSRTTWQELRREAERLARFLS